MYVNGYKLDYELVCPSKKKLDIGGVLKKDKRGRSFLGRTTGVVFGVSLLAVAAGSYLYLHGGDQVISNYLQTSFNSMWYSLKDSLKTMSQNAGQSMCDGVNNIFKEYLDLGVKIDCSPVKESAGSWVNNGTMNNAKNGILNGVASALKHEKVRNAVMYGGIFSGVVGGALVLNNVMKTRRERQHDEMWKHYKKYIKNTPQYCAA